MKKRIAGAIGVLFLVLLAGESPAQPANSELQETLQARFPDIEFKSVAPSPVKGWYEVQTPGELVYTNEDASLLFAGSLIDTKTKEDLTARRLSVINAIDFDSLPLDLAIKTVRGNGSRKIAVFSDPLCPFCQQLEKQLVGVTDITIYTFLYPLEAVHPGATIAARKLWCAEKREKSWFDWMVNAIEPPTRSCDDSAIQTLVSLGDGLKISATPTLFLASGRRVVGVIPNAKLEQELAAIPAASAAVVH